MKERLDVLLVKRNLASSREKAKAIIMSGNVFVDGQREDKAGTSFSEEVQIEVRGHALPYVSRGGLKLEKAMKNFDVSMEGKVCTDVGSSTGGFTDCMLQNGAVKVFAIDVGHGQLDWKLRQDERVVCMEKTNIRYVQPEDLGEPIDFSSIDVSFISLSNAVKYNRENGHIYISCVEIPSEQPETAIMKFVCRDTGIGMAEEFQKHIFEPFAQEHAGSRTKFAGTGLGMPITKKLVEKMGGTIMFKSKEGVGTTFVIQVPFRIDLATDKRKEQKDASEKTIKGLHILLAEDNELNMEIAEFMFQNEGAEVTKAWNGLEAVEIFEKSRPGEFDVILMDIMMPVMNGYNATKRIRSMDREDAKEIPIIAMTANAFTEDRIRAKEAGMDEHISKPVDGNLLVKVIHELLN